MMHFSIILRRFVFAALFALTILAAPSAFAACANPSGAEGDVIYNDDYDVVQFCDGNDNWIRMGASSALDDRIGTLTAGKWCSSNGTILSCTEDAPSGGGATPAGTDGQIQFNESSALQADAALHWDNTNKRLGIGTATPASALDINNNVSGGTTRMVVANPATAASSTAEVQALGGSTYMSNVAYGTGEAYTITNATGGYTVGTYGTGAMSLITDGNTRLHIDSSGNVGIGTATPAARLDVNGSSYLQYTQITASVDVPADEWSAALNLKTPNSADGNKARINFSTGSDVMAQLEFGRSGTNQGYMALRTRPSGIAEVMRLTHDGKVGIGITAPTQALDVAGKAAATGVIFKAVSGAAAPGGGTEVGGTSGQVQFNDGSGFEGDANLVWDNSTKSLGIGTATPVTSLHIKGAQAGIFLEETNGGANNETFIVHYNNILQIQNRNSDFTNAVTPYAFDMRAPASTLYTSQVGNVGIGMAPMSVAGNKLAADANANSSPLVLYSLQSNDAFSVLPWTGLTYLGTGLYYSNNTWVHDGHGNNNALFAFGSMGATWYASNNGTASWNVAGGVSLWNQAGVLAGASSRTFKEQFTPINKHSVLERISALDIQQWKYKGEEQGINHIGPVAEEWHEAFNTGDDEKYIPLVDGIGVSLVGVQALKEENDALKAQIQLLTQRLDALEARQ